MTEGSRGTGELHHKNFSTPVSGLSSISSPPPPTLTMIHPRSSTLLLALLVPLLSGSALGNVEYREPDDQEEIAAAKQVLVDSWGDESIAREHLGPYPGSVIWFVCVVNKVIVGTAIAKLGAETDQPALQEQTELTYLGTVG